VNIKDGGKKVGLPGCLRRRERTRERIAPSPRDVKLVLYSGNSMIYQNELHFEGQICNSME